MAGAQPASVGQPQPPRPAGPSPAYQPPVRTAQPPVASPGAPAVPKKKGPLVWILAGCLGLIVIGGILIIAGGYFVANKIKQAGLDPALIQKNPGLAVVKMMVAANPDIEILGVDEDRGIIKVRDKKDGKTLTINLEDAKNGKIVFLDEKGEKVEINAKGEGDQASMEVRTAEGTMRMGGDVGKLPDWLPMYPGAKADGTFGLTSKEGEAASFQLKTSDSPAKVAAFYESALKSKGFEVGKMGEGETITLTANDPNSERTAGVIISGSSEGTTVMLNFQNKQ
jgi:hypothetical protein